METNYAVPPGEYILEWAAEYGVSLTDLAERLRLPVPDLQKIVSGAAPVTQDLADRLAEVTGIPVVAWLRLETRYQADRARLDARVQEAVSRVRRGEPRHQPRAHRRRRRG